MKEDGSYFVRGVLSHCLKRRLPTLCSIKALIVCPGGDGISLNSVRRTKELVVKDGSFEDAGTLTIDKGISARFKENKGGL